MGKLRNLAGYVLALGIGLASGCATHTESGLAAGSLLGAGTGALLAGKHGNPLVGAGIGAGVGAVAGGLVGSGLDENDRRNAARIAAATQPVAVANALSVADVIQMSGSGVSEEVIIASIRGSNSLFQLTGNDIVDLHNRGVNDRVIQAMLDHRPQPLARGPAYVGGAPVYYEAVPVVEPAPQVYLGFGYGYGYRPHRCW